MSKINILIADDHKLIRETWSYILNSDARFQVIAECGDAQEAVELAKTKRPHVVLMDINMTPFSGLEATQRIRELTERFIEAAKAAGNQSLDAYEQSLRSLVEFEERTAGASQLDWVSSIAAAHAKFVQDVSAAYVSAARNMLK